MKKLLFILTAALFIAATPIQDCKIKNIPLYGRVQVVESHADFDVQVVESHEDLRVQVVESHASQCGLWMFVESHADFTIRYVQNHSDFTIRFVQSHPGSN